MRATRTIHPRDVLDSSDDGTRSIHDAWNRLVRVQTVDGGSTFADVASYQYNGLHWRTLRDNGVDERDLFYYSSDWQLIEERRHAYSGGNPLPGTLSRVAQQFWGLRSIERRRGTARNRATGLQLLPT